MNRSDKSPAILFWFRRDLRLEDNRGLQAAFDEALRTGQSLHCLFVLDSHILQPLPKDDKRVEFILLRLEILREKMEALGGKLWVQSGDPKEIIDAFFAEHNISSLYFNEDYEPYARARDAAIAKMAASRQVRVQTSKDHVIFAPGEVLKDNGQPYLVYTPFARKWQMQLQPADFAVAPVGERWVPPSGESPSVGRTVNLALELSSSSLTSGSPTTFPSSQVPKHILTQYHLHRNRLDIKSTSQLGLHLRFGTISIRKAVQIARQYSPVFLKELIWREFFIHLLWHFPQTEHEPFDSRFQDFQWRNDPQDFDRWVNGETGYPLVDAGMRELRQTGYMHNRVRMTAASFLTKHLLIDWRRGERHFARYLLDFELASNVGNWQWVAGCGCDAAPYFRIFNPALQAQKFDPTGLYTQTWVPEVQSTRYAKPMVNHEVARKRALAEYERINRKRSSL